MSRQVGVEVEPHDPAYDMPGCSGENWAMGRNGGAGGLVAPAAKAYLEGPRAEHRIDHVRIGASGRAWAAATTNLTLT